MCENCDPKHGNSSAYPTPSFDDSVKSHALSMHVSRGEPAPSVSKNENLRKPTREATAIH